MKKILIIEDERNIRETLADILSIHGYTTLLAPNGKDGIHLAMNQEPDIIFCDVSMPDMDGYEVLSALRKAELLPFIPFIFLTAKSSMEELRKGMEAGADDYIIKPFNHESLLRTIKAVEEKKLVQLHQLNALQHQLNLEKLKIRDIDHLNSHEIRRKLSIIQSLFPLVKDAEISLDDAMKIMEESGEQLDAALHKISRIINRITETDKNLKPATLHTVKTIWLIDDDSTQVLLTRMMLHKTNPNWLIHTFQHPEEALNQLKFQPPDLIFLDINMPGMDGFEFLRELSALPVDLQVIMLSSSISPADIQRSMEYRHVINYLTKPLKRNVVAELFSS